MARGKRQDKRQEVGDSLPQSILRQSSIAISLKKLAAVLEELPPKGVTIQHYDSLIPRDALTQIKEY